MTQDSNQSDAKPTSFVVTDGPVGEIYVDGNSELLLGFPNSKILFHTTVAPPADGNPEVRQPAIRLVLPTSVLIELCTNILNFIRTNPTAVTSSLDQYALDATRRINQLINAESETPK